jgi:hypothetical protein
MVRCSINQLLALALLVVCSCWTECTALKRPQHSRNGRYQQPVSEEEQIKAVTQQRALTFREAMVCGALSRSIAQTALQPMNVVKVKPRT